MKKYLPIKIFSINFAYGWWWGGYFFFFTPFAIIPMWLHRQDCTYENGKAIDEAIRHTGTGASTMEASRWGHSSFPI